MRMFISLVLMTLIMLLGQTGGSLSTVASTTKASYDKFVDHGAVVHTLVATHYNNIKRNLRGDSKKATSDPNSQEQVIGGEDRIFNVGNLLDRVKTTLNQSLRKGKDKFKNYLFKDAYHAGDTPDSLRAAFYGKKTREELLANSVTRSITNFMENLIRDYRLWLDQVRKTGQVPKK